MSSTARHSVSAWARNLPRDGQAEAEREAGADAGRGAGEAAMRVLVIFAHPVETSYGAALKARAVAALSVRHEVDLLDLYAEGFDPVMSRSERLGYHAIPDNRAPVEPYVAQLLRAEAIVFCF